MPIPTNQLDYWNRPAPRSSGFMALPVFPVSNFRCSDFVFVSDFGFTPARNFQLSKGALIWRGYEIVIVVVVLEFTRFSNSKTRFQPPWTINDWLPTICAKLHRGADIK